MENNQKQKLRDQLVLAVTNNHPSLIVILTRELLQLGEDTDSLEMHAKAYLENPGVHIYIM